MTHHRATASPPTASGITDLMQDYGERWTIAFEATLNVWSAERRSPDGRHVRFLAEHDPADLAAKLAAAEVSEP